MEEPIRRVHISQVLNLGWDLRQRLEAVAAREHIDATCLGRRIVEAAVSARERTEADDRLPQRVNPMTARLPPRLPTGGGGRRA